MASTNLDLVRSIYAAWERGDFSSAEWAHPEIEYLFADGPSPGSWMGLAGLEEGFRSFASAWDEYRLEADEFRELDAERVLVLDHGVGRGKKRGRLPALVVGCRFARGAIAQVETSTAGPSHARVCA